jgi:hypothetical protein
MRAPAIAWALVVATTSVGCEGGLQPVEDDGAGETGGDRPGTVLLADVDAGSACDLVGAVEVQMRARFVDCEHPPPAPCTKPVNPPDLLGDRFSCPAGDPTSLMGVQVTMAGRYYVDAIISFATADPQTECYARDGDVEVLVTSEEVEMGIDPMVEPTGAPCPSL